MCHRRIRLGRRLGRGDPQRLEHLEDHLPLRERVGDQGVLVVRSEFRVGIDAALPLLDAAEPREVDDPWLERIDQPGHVERRGPDQRLLELRELRGRLQPGLHEQAACLLGDQRQNSRVVTHGERGLDLLVEPRPRHAERPERAPLDLGLRGLGNAVVGGHGVGVQLPDGVDELIAELEQVAHPLAKELRVIEPQHDGRLHERERLALSATTLPQLLRASGYTTGIFGKWHLGDEEPYQPGRRGFDRSVIHGAGGIGQSYPGSCGDVPGNRYLDPVVRVDGAFETRPGYCTDIFFDAALSWIGEVSRTDKPFFGLITPNAPHDPLDCPEGSDAGPRERLAAAGLLDAAGRDRVARFYGMIENIDTNVGRLLDRLDSSGIAADTLLIFTTDNGTATGAGVCNDAMRGAKGSVWRGGTRVPSLWRWPGTLPAGVDVPALVAHVDILPTLCEVGLAEIPADVAGRIEGRSLVPLLHRPDAPWPERALVTHLGRWERGEVAGAKWRHCRIREGRYSLVNVANRADGWQLFDVVADPSESRDVASVHGAIVAHLAGEYDRWWASIQDDLVNEDLDGPTVNPFKSAFERQCGAGATAAMMTAP